MEREVVVSFAPPRSEDPLAALQRALSLVYGIGPVREAFLRRRGYSTLLDLTGHPRFGRDAAFWVETISRRRLSTLYQGLCRWYSASHPLVLSLWGLAFPERVILIDLESLGLSTLPVFLVAIGKFDRKNGALTVKQFLARSLGEEMAILAKTLEEIPADPLVVSYNGKAHDWRQLGARLAYYGFPELPEAAHLDLLFFVRRLWREELSDCSLVQAERRVLGRTRAVDIPGEEVPVYYQAFLQTGNPRFLRPILAHNFEDVVSLAYLLEKIRACYDRAFAKA